MSRQSRKNVLHFNSVLGVGVLDVGGGREFLVEVDVHLDVAGDVDALRSRDGATAGRGWAGRAGPVLVVAPLVDLERLLLPPEIPQAQVGDFRTWKRYGKKYLEKMIVQGDISRW